MKLKNLIISLISSLFILAAGLIVLLKKNSIPLDTRIFTFLEDILLIIFIFLLHKTDSIAVVVSISFCMIGVGIAFRCLLPPISYLGNTLTLLGLVVVVLYSKRLLNKLKERAYLDHLTKLYTRTFFHEEWLPREIERQRRRNGRITFIFIDLDNLKEINDKFSHHVGDEALKILAKVIKESIRLTDAAVRYGGDEFLIALPEESIETAKEIVARIRRSLKKEKFKVGISITAGITEWKVGKDVMKIIKEADEKMYELKRRRKRKDIEETYQEDQSDLSF